MASCGSSDGFVYVYDTTSLGIKWKIEERMRYRYRLPGHKSGVNDVDFHPIEPIICSVSSDHSVILGEILPLCISLNKQWNKQATYAESHHKGYLHSKLRSSHNMECFLHFIDKENHYDHENHDNNERMITQNSNVPFRGH